MNLLFEEETKKTRRRQLLKESGYFLLAAVLVILLAWLIVHFALKKASMIGSSMQTTLYNGEDLIVNRTSYKLFSPKRGAVIAFYPETDENEEHTDSSILVRRVVGLPGEQVQIKDGLIYINGEPLSEKYKFDPIESAGRALEPVTLEKNEYFVMSDKRGDLDDSRSTSFTKVYKKQIIGKVVFSLNPFALIGGPKEEGEE